MKAKMVFAMCALMTFSFTSTGQNSAICPGNTFTVDTGSYHGYFACLSPECAEAQQVPPSLDGLLKDIVDRTRCEGDEQVHPCNNPYYAYEMGWGLTKAAALAELAEGNSSYKTRAQIVMYSCTLLSGPPDVTCNWGDLLCVAVSTYRCCKPGL